MISSNYEQSNLCNRSLKGQDLRGVTFYGADIRGVNFKNAILTGANFSHSRAGLSPSRSLGLIIGALVLVAIAGLVIGYSSAFPAFIANLLAERDSAGKELLITLGLSILASFVFVIIRQGLGASLGILAVISAVITAIVAFAGTGNNSITAAAILQSVIIAMIVAGVLVESLALSIFLSIAKAKALALPIIIALAIAVLGGQEGVKNSPSATLLISLFSTAFIAIALIGLSVYISIRAMGGDQRYRLFREISISLCAKLGTNFQGANLTDTDFTQAILPYTDFRKATLKRISWFQASRLELSHLEGTYLEDPILRSLVVSRDGHGKIYDYKNLEGLNLHSANLVDASFIGADLNETNLQNADLTRAKLVKTRLYGADLTHSCLTGACIQDWAISTDTQLGKVTCTHIYMRLPTQEDPDPWRKPDNRNETFQEGDFTDFIAPIIKTLDLYRQQNIDPRQIANTFKSLDFYHYGGIDPAAAAIALQQLAEENPEAGLEVVALEGRGEEKVRLQAVVTGAVDSSQLNVKYFEKYRQISSLPYNDIQALLAGAVEKDKRIRSLENLLENALQQPKFYVETVQNNGEFIMSQSKGNVNISGVQGNISGIAAAGESQTMTGVALGDVSGSVTNTINQSPPSSTSDIPGIQDLLAQLKAAIESEATLPNEDKSEALEQVKILAKAGQNPSDSGSQKAAKTAIKILKGTAAELPNTPLTAELNRLLPTIANILAKGGDATPPVKSILLLAANPKGTPTLRLDEEARALQNGLERSRYRDQFAIQQRWAVTPTEVRRALLDLKPKIVHFSGHGIGRDPNPTQSPTDARKLNAPVNSATEPEGLMFENEIGQPQLVSSESLAELFGLFADHIECVVLNACYSEAQAEAISRHIPYVIGMKRAIGDQAAIKFAIGFYDALLAGESVEFAYRLGCNSIQMEGIPEQLTPVLKQRST
jgi:uncharacterized protein YjbI with pentapeptide repeats